MCSVDVPEPQVIEAPAAPPPAPSPAKVESQATKKTAAANKRRKAGTSSLKINKPKQTARVQSGGSGLQIK